MTIAGVVDLMRGALLTTFWLSLPILAAGFVIGIVMSLIQILTSIQDSGFNAVPRLTAFLAAFVLSMPWMLGKLISYTEVLFGDLGKFARSNDARTAAGGDDRVPAGAGSRGGRDCLPADSGFSRRADAGSCRSGDGDRVLLIPRLAAARRCAAVIRRAGGRRVLRSRARSDHRTRRGVPH